MKDDPDFMERINRDLAAREAARKILGVEEKADAAQLKKAYKQAAVQYHPDHNGGTPEANQKFALVRCAYELLAFDKPCDALLAEDRVRPDVPADETYRLDNAWGHFCWWRDKFFGS